MVTTKIVAATTDNGARLAETGQALADALMAFDALVAELFFGSPPDAHALTVGELAGVVSSLEALGEGLQDILNLVIEVSHGAIIKQ